MISSFNSFIEKNITFDIETDQLKITNVYRYLSWFFTSIFYVCSPSLYEIYKFGVIISLFICSNIISKAYTFCENKISIVKTFVIIETMGIILLVLTTGGLKSPFIWYALNPILVSASFSLYYFCWLNLICYLSISIAISYLIFNPEKYKLVLLIRDNSHIVLTFILITMAVCLLSILANKLRKKSNDLISTMVQLSQVNEINRESLEHIKSLYRMVEALNELDSKRNIHQIFADYLTKLTKADITFFLLEATSDDLNRFAINGDCSTEMRQAILQKLNNIWDKNLINNNTLYFKLGLRNFCVLSVKSNLKNYGLIGVDVSDFLTNLNKKEIENNLEFIANLSAVILDRFHLEEVNHRLLLSEEQNRIANEMHDNVIQQLFGISCVIHTTLENLDNIQKNDLREKLLLVQNSAQSVMKGLRSMIHNLSSRKGGLKNFQFSINNFLENISKLYNIKVEFTMEGDEELIDMTKKKGLYRIICEATGNAVRHGKCSTISINLTIIDESIELIIIDNGNGFDINCLKNKSNYGLGLKNMSNLTKILGGKINIDSALGRGTIITICINNEHYENLVKGSLII